jgi:hypothetical protein
MAFRCVDGFRWSAPPLIQDGGPRWASDGGPSWIWFPSIRGQTSGSIDPISLWLIGGDNRKVPFDDQLRRSSKMAAI